MMKKYYALFNCSSLSYCGTLVRSHKYTLTSQDTLEYQENDSDVHKGNRKIDVCKVNLCVQGKATATATAPCIISGVASSSSMVTALRLYLLPGGSSATPQCSQ
jgi:hypothetical protein